MKASGKSIRESYYTFSFSPFMLTLFKEDLIYILDITKGAFPKANVQIGKSVLEKEISNELDINELSKKSNYAEYHCLYIYVQTTAEEHEKTYLIVDISPSSYNLFVSNSSDEKLLRLYREIKEVILNRNIYRFFKNKVVYTFVIVCDIFFLLYILFLKDVVEKLVNANIPDGLFLMFVLLVNIVFIVPHGKNKIYLNEESKVSIFAKNREVLLIGGIILVIGVIIFFNIMKLLGV